MAYITQRRFDVLDPSGERYFEWKVDALTHLKANGLGSTIVEDNKSSEQDKAKAIIFLRNHLHESLKFEYLTVEDPKELWDNLRERYENHIILLPKALDEWRNLRFYDFESISDYNSALFRIAAQLRSCGQKITDSDLLEKTYTTMHPSNSRLQQQYRIVGFKRYSELIPMLLVAEQNNELWMNNYNSQPSQGGSVRGRGCKQGRNKGRGQHPRRGLYDHRTSPY